MTGPFLSKIRNGKGYIQANVYIEYLKAWGYVGFMRSRDCYLYLSYEEITWWRHQMETVSALLVICAGNSPVPGEFLAQRPVTRGFDVFFDLRPNKRLSKQSWGWWFETSSRPLWRHRYAFWRKLAWEYDTTDKELRILHHFYTTHGTHTEASERSIW